MTKNLGTIDRIIRLIIALGLLYVAFAYYQTSFVLAIVAFIIALILAVNVILGFCLMYKIFGISTRKEPGVSAPNQSAGSSQLQ